MVKSEQIKNEKGIFPSNFPLNFAQEYKRLCWINGKLNSVERAYRTKINHDNFLMEKMHPSTYMFAKWSSWKIENNENVLAVFIGKPGAGKSFAALSLAEILDPDFSIKRVAFNSTEFINILKDESIPSGSVIVFDEAGVGINAKQFQSTTNKMINYIMQVFRYRNLIVFFTVPHFDFIDKSTRSLFHAMIEPIKKNKSETMSRSF